MAKQGHDQSGKSNTIPLGLYCASSPTLPFAQVQILCVIFEMEFNFPAFPVTFMYLETTVCHFSTHDDIIDDFLIFS